MERLFPCIQIHTDTHTDAHRHTQTQTQTDRQTDTHTHAQTHTHIHTHTHITQLTYACTNQPDTVMLMHTKPHTYVSGVYIDFVFTPPKILFSVKSLFQYI